MTQEGAAKDYPHAYLCIPDSTVGYRYDGSKKAWVAAVFDTRSKKYVFRELHEGEKRREASSRWAMFDFNEDQQTAIIECPGSPARDILFTSCVNMLSHFVLDENTLRFQYYEMGDFTRAQETDKNGSINDDLTATPFLAIGRCSPL